MGNTAYRFFVSFFGIALTLIIFVNLLFFTGLVDFGDIEHSEVYFGFSSFMNTFSSLDNLMNNFNFNGFFSFESLDTCMKGCLNVMSGGLNDLITFATQANDTSDFFTFNFNLPSLPTLIDVSGADAIIDVVKNIATLIDYGINVITSIFNGLGFIGELLKAVVTFMLQPLILSMYLLWILGFLLYYTFILISWLLMLLRGEFYSVLPNPDEVVTSSWQDVVDDWTSQWENLTAIV